MNKFVVVEMVSNINGINLLYMMKKWVVLHLNSNMPSNFDIAGVSIAKDNICKL